MITKNKNGNYYKDSTKSLQRPSAGAQLSAISHAEARRREGRQGEERVIVSGIIFPLAFFSLHFSLFF
jgi:hypothetical protein